MGCQGDAQTTDMTSALLSGGQGASTKHSMVQHAAQVITAHDAWYNVQQAQQQHMPGAPMYTCVLLPALGLHKSSL